ncbi:unnamed protein product [Rangifer tarandus platyrhynchus]|uniref:Uncharacterized protein n=1 Tax=Rangifer tarandus platyrhynchus TaxID=3082113 RepID=A0ACB1KHL3_RANTA
MIIPAYKKVFCKIRTWIRLQKKGNPNPIHLAGVFSIEKATRIFAYNILNKNHLLAIQLKQGRVHIKQEYPFIKKHLHEMFACRDVFFHMSQDSCSKMVNFFFFFGFYHIEEKLQALKSNTLILSP